MTAATPMLEDAGPLLLLSVVLIAGVASGVLARRVRLPAVTGQILAGILFGPSVLGYLDHAAVKSLQPMTHFAVGLMAVAVGSHLSLTRLRNATRRLSILVLLEITITPSLVFLALYVAPGSSATVATLLAALAITTAPATVLAIVKETRSRGVFVKTLLAAVALNNIACIGMFELAHTAVRVALSPEVESSVFYVLIAPLKQFGLSAVLGGGIGVVLLIATRHVVRQERLTTASIIAILLTAGLADHLGISTLLACLVLGIVLANLTPDKEELGHEAFANFESAIFAVFFVLAGTELDFELARQAGPLALVMFLARFAGKVTAAGLAMRIAGATERVRRYLGIALVPQAGLTVALLLLVSEDEAFAPIRDLFLAVGLTVVLLNELVGPLLTRFALARSGDMGMDRPRLIDFLREECIITDLRADSYEAAIEQLVGVLAKVEPKCDREAFTESVMTRERDGSTCLGSGLAVPHGEIVGAERIVGAMGISGEGLNLPTPDGRPVHCIVLLATPATQRDRHLEVLAALAQAIRGDRSIQHQLYHAKSAAHAAELLNTEEAEDFNYFIED